MIDNKSYLQMTNILFEYDQIFEVNSEFFNKLYRKFIKEIKLDIFEFYIKYRDEILEIFENKIELEEDVIKLINRDFKRRINNTSLRYIDFSKEFLELVDHNYYYRKYFNWFKRYYLHFFKDIDFPVEYIGLKCLIEEDIEVPSENYIKIIITLPLEDEYYNFVLKLMSAFIRKQELLFKYLIFNYNHQKELFESFKKTFFIFNSIDE